MLKEVRSSHLLETYKIYEGENNIYCVGQYCSGGTLYEYLKSHGKPTLPHSISIIKQLVVALNYLESKHLIHRDLKPENILFDDKSLQGVTLVDFGFMTRAKEYNLLFTRCGTPGYVAPEVLADKPYDTKIDVYSLGILFYILLTKVNPFNHKSYSKLIQRNKSGAVDFQLLDSIKSDQKSTSKI
jgi:calcium/calmodulin-dependent protein kinase I